jgi:hypothetical protein
MFSYLNYFIKNFYTFSSLSVRFADTAAINCITTQRRESPFLSTFDRPYYASAFIKAKNLSAARINNRSCGLHNSFSSQSTPAENFTMQGKAGSVARGSYTPYSVIHPQ